MILLSDIGGPMASGEHRKTGPSVLASRAAIRHNDTKCRLMFIAVRI